MNKWFKINDRNSINYADGWSYRNFTAIDINLQYTIQGRNPHSIGVTSCDIILTLIAPIGSSDYNYIMNLYDNSYNYASDYKFEIISDKFKSVGCIIKNINFNPSNNLLTLDVISDYVQTKDLSERRDEIIDYILDKTKE